jgi:hypothetical protein
MLHLRRTALQAHQLHRQAMLVDTIADLIEDEYRTIALDPTCAIRSSSR